MNSEELKLNIKKAKAASQTLLQLSAKQRKAVLLDVHSTIMENIGQILSANKKDISEASKEKPESFVERLSLDEKKVQSMADTVKKIADSRDNLFSVLTETKRPSGIRIKKVISPLGLIAIIYESRPNVTMDAFALTFKSGNAVILKGGKEIQNTNNILVGIIKKVFKKHHINENIITDVSDIDQKLSLQILKDSNIDCLIPRGGKNLINFCLANSQIPMIITGASIVHTYVDKSADLEMAQKIAINAKTRRVSICNALDVLLLHKNISHKFLAGAWKKLSEKNVEIRADKRAYEVLKKFNYPKLKKANEKDFDTEFLDYVLAIKTVDNFDQALEHIASHSLGHSEAIVTRDKKQAEKFFRKIDAACLYWNTSTQFSDGGEFGMGGEIGISTQKLHARGPFSYQELTTYKYLVESQGATRN